MIYRISRLWRTLRYLKLRQIFFRLWYAVQQRMSPSNGQELMGDSKAYAGEGARIALAIADFEPSNFLVSPGAPSYSEPGKFSFLNLTYDFGDTIDWNHKGFRKLWTYNLCYFEYLFQPGLTREQGVKLLQNFIGALPAIKDGIEPYPVSLRLVNWVKFCLLHQINDPKILASIAAHIHYLSRHKEHHILGNHLLENALALCVGYSLTGNEKQFSKSYRLLKAQLEEQILPDGAHYERSAMYHQILLGRILDVIQIFSGLHRFKTQVDDLTGVASKMLGWIDQVSFGGSRFPLFNDAAFEIAPPLTHLKALAATLQIKPKKLTLGDSGFRKFTGVNWEMAVDIGTPAPAYQPGHAHAGIFTFELYLNNSPVVVDTGTSTYNAGRRRLLERSTMAHNTVSIDHRNSSEVWASHRVGRRADVTIHRDNAELLEVSHNGYLNRGVRMYRRFEKSNGLLLIHDWLEVGKNRRTGFKEAMLRLHFHPARIIEMKEEGVVIDNELRIAFRGADSLKMDAFDYAPRFNQLYPSTVLEIKFSSELTTIFYVE